MSGQEGRAPRSLLDLEDTRLRYDTYQIDGKLRVKTTQISVSAPVAILEWWTGKRSFFFANTVRPKSDTM